MKHLVKAYKVFEERDGQPFFMFYGIDGSKKVIFNQTLKCDKKQVSDGSGKRRYVSGFHVYKTLDTLLKFAKTLRINKNSRFIVQIWASNLRKKHERSRAYLSDEIIVIKKAWNNRTSIRAIPFLLEGIEWVTKK